MNSLERAVEHAEYLVALGKQNPAALLASPINPSSKGKSIHQKLLELHIEETAKQEEDQGLQHNTHLLAKLVKRDKLNCLVLNLYPGNEGYSLLIKSKSGIETETFKIPYEVTELLDYVDDSQLPPFLVDVLEKAQVNLFYNGCVIVEVRDFRCSSAGSYDTKYVLLRPTPQSLLCDINNLTNDGHIWTQEDIFHLEGKLLLATEEPLCLDPSPAVLMVSNRQQYERKLLNTPMLKRAVKKYSQAAINRKRKFAQNSAPPELKLHDFIAKKKDRKSSSLNAKYGGKMSVDSWKPKPVTLKSPDQIDVEKLAKVIEKPEKSIIKENSLSLVEEQVLERDVTAEKKLLAKLTIFHRPCDDAYLGELYLDHDYVEGKSKGAICKFLLGNKEAVRKYLDQFKEIFTEEGRRVVKITTQRPGQLPIVTCTQTIPSAVPVGALPTSQVGTKPTTPTTQAMDVTPVTTPSMSNVGGLKRAMPIQLSLSIGPSPSSQPSGQNQGQLAHNQQGFQGQNQLQLNLPSQQINQSQMSTQRLQTSSQSQSASQRLKQLGIHTSIGSRNNTPTASPVNSQAPIAQLFGSPTSVGNSPLLTQTNVSKTPTNTPTATPPPPIVSPPAAPVTGSRKSSGGSESSTVHHMAQTPHQANVATLLQGQGETTSHTTQSSSVNHQSANIANINIANITGIPPNINIQNITGLPGMNIANLQGLQNMQVSLSVPGGIAVPISMISTNPILQSQHQQSQPQQQQQQQQPQQQQQQQGGMISSTAPSMASTQTLPTSTMSGQGGQSSMVTMVTQLPTSSAPPVPTTTTQVVTAVLSSPSNVMPSPSMLSVPIGNLTQLVQPGLKPHGQLRGSTSLPVFQLSNQSIQLVTVPQRMPLKAGAIPPQGQISQLQTGVKPTTSAPGTLSTTVLQAGHQQPILSQLSVGKGNQQGGIATVTHQQLLQIPQLAHLQAFQKPQQQPQQTQQQLHFHQILKPTVPSQSSLTIGGKPKNKKRTTPTPPKQ